MLIVGNHYLFSVEEVAQSLAVVARVLATEEPQGRVDTAGILLNPLDQLPIARHGCLELVEHSSSGFCQSVCKKDSHINFFFRKINSDK